MERRRCARHVKVGEGGKLYGSITAKDIADALGRRAIVVDRHTIVVEPTG